MILCVIIMKDGHLLLPEVNKSLIMQSIPLAIMPITREPIKEEANNDSKSSNYLSQAFNRNIAKDLVLKKYKGKYSLWHCCDVALLRFDCVALAKEVLDKDDKIGAVYFNTTLTTLSVFTKDDDHLDFSSVLVRNSALKDIVFRSDKIDICNCFAFRQDLLLHGWRTQYLSNENMGQKVFNYDIGDLK